MSGEPWGGVTDPELAEQLAAGSSQALEQLYDRYAALAYSVAMRVLSDPGKAEDVVQEVFLKLWKGATAFDASRGSLRTWLLVAVRNRSIDHLRGRAGHERFEKDISQYAAASGAGSDPWQEVAQSMEREAVRQAVNSLPAEQRQALELAYFGGYTQREIAAMISLPVSTVKGRVRLGLEKVHSYLQGRGFVDE